MCVHCRRYAEWQLEVREEDHCNPIVNKKVRHGEWKEKKRPGEEQANTCPHPREETKTDGTSPYRDSVFITPATSLLEASSKIFRTITTLRFGIFTDIVKLRFPLLLLFFFFPSIIFLNVSFYLSWNHLKVFWAFFCVKKQQPECKLFIRDVGMEKWCLNSPHEKKRELEIKESRDHF